jgi:hypothetical protein
MGQVQMATTPSAVMVADALSLEDATSGHGRVFSFF